MNFLLFIIFSIIEAISIFSIMIYGFRFRLKEHYRTMLIMSALMSVISYGMREQLGLSAFTPLVLLLLFIVYFSAAVRLPLFWSAIVAIIGYMAFIVVQMTLIAVFQALAVVDLEQIKLLYTFDAYLIQTVELAVILPAMKLLFEKGYGFNFPFDTLQFKGERIFVVTAMVLGIASIGCTLYFLSFYWVFIVLIAAFLFVIYLALREERELYAHSDNSR